MREIKHLSVHQWLRSAIPDSQQPTSPIGFLFLKLPPPPCAVLLVSYPIISPLYHHLRSFKHHVCLTPPGTSALHPFTAVPMASNLGRSWADSSSEMGNLDFLIKASKKLLLYWENQQIPNITIIKLLLYYVFSTKIIPFPIGKISNHLQHMQGNDKLYIYTHTYTFT